MFFKEGFLVFSNDVLYSICMYTGIVDELKPPPPLYRLVHVPHCISQLALSTLLLLYEEYCPDRPQYIKIVVLPAMFSLSMQEHVYSQYSMYPMISMVFSHIALFI
jgi:hypothetical protein